MSEHGPQMAEVYWERRARKFAGHGRGLAAVCSYGMPAFYNSYIAHTQRRALLPWLPRVAPGTSAALDLGCGVGRWTLELASRGHDVTGVDLSPHMIERARGNANVAGVRCSLAVGDGASLRLGRTFDLIVCVTVLQHILEPSRVHMAARRLAAHLAPHGTLVLLEAAPDRATARCDTAVFHARPVDWYIETLRAAGLTVTCRRGVDPAPFKTWLLPHYRRFPRPLANLALALATAAALPFERLVQPWFPEAGWHKVLVARHASELAASSDDGTGERSVGR